MFARSAPVARIIAKISARKLRRLHDPSFMKKPLTRTDASQAGQSELSARKTQALEKEEDAAHETGPAREELTREARKLAESQSTEENA